MGVSAHPCQWRDLVVVNGILVMGYFSRHVVVAVNYHQLGELPIISFVLKDVGKLEGGFFAAGVALMMRLLRDLLAHEIRHGKENKLIAHDQLIGAEVEQPYAARGASLTTEVNELSCPWAHGIVRHGVGRNGVVAKTYAQVALRVELETGELLVWADLVYGGNLRILMLT